MPQHFRLAAFYTSVIKQMVSVRFLFLIAIVSFLVSVVFIQSAKKNDRLVQEAIENISRDIRYIDVYRKPSKLSNDVKYILLWTSHTYSPLYFLGNGQEAFVRNNCPVIDCYVTTDRTLFGGDVSRFDAIAFNGRNLKDYRRRSQLPLKRSMRQKYIFFNLESSDNYPICSARYDDYFNWTATYKLNSDIPYPYLLIKNNKGEIVGPKVNMEWVEEYSTIDDELADKLKSKTKAIAWFVSSCSVRSKRNKFVKIFRKALSHYRLDIDVYGKCGTFKCPIEKKEDCHKMLEKDYFFYLSMENSFAEDYITEKVLTALQHNIVPILYGAANYTRFLPPGSYLDARKQNVKSLADIVARLIEYPNMYRDYFKWKRYYNYYDPTAKENVCAVCAALHNKTMMETVTMYKTFRRWWYPPFKKRCSWYVDDDD
ncbi:unnamed protein product [Diatraea saccharalis]|uniref:Fucosyltransferase n=1 Tax=Diatraea saccharalis TaxID=40085 RepID=A0A9N9N1L7_9NEOP|nr:unnamed protein product [Diatraea saccharalis]